MSKKDDKVLAFRREDMMNSIKMIKIQLTLSVNNDYIYDLIFINCLSLSSFSFLALSNVLSKETTPSCQVSKTLLKKDAQYYKAYWYLIG